jgi:hypothetical protein
VVDTQGNAVARAVVVTSAGGQAVSETDGSFRLSIQLSSNVLSVRITAISGTDANHVASLEVPIASTTNTIPTGTLALQSTSTCQPSWLPSFGEQPGTNDVVLALTVFDDGSGPALYVGGLFRTAGAVVANDIAKWNGSSWSSLAGGMTGNPSYPNLVLAMCVFDDGGGPALYAGGHFIAAGGVAANNIAKWNGSSWSPLGSGVNSGVTALKVFSHGGGGPSLYVGGVFSSAGGIAAQCIARWNGSSWASVGGGLGNSPAVSSLAVFNDGTGAALFVGGSFQNAGGVPASNIARWNGSNWSPLGSGTNIGYVNALTVFDDGSGQALYAGGDFTAAGGVTANHIAKWNGSTWSALGSGMGGLGYNTSVESLTVFDDGTGAALYAGGIFTSAGTVTANYIAKWDGSSWSALPSEIHGFGADNQVFALAALEGSGGPALYAGGFFSSAGAAVTDCIANWNGSSWSALGKGMDGSVDALKVFDDGSGSALYAGGSFTTVGGIPEKGIAKWNGSSWSPVGGGTDGTVHAMTIYDDGTGPAL